jgi:hypothetical protein
MMVICQSHSIKLRIIHEDGKVQTLHYDNRKARDADKAWYIGHGFKCK